MKSILIIEDEPTVADSLQKYFRDNFYNTEIADSIANSKSILKSQPFDLICLDWNLSDGEGIEVLKYLRSENNNTPIILLTARDDIFDKVLALELGANDYITKPFNPRELLARVKVQLRSQSANSIKENNIILNDKILELNTKTHTVIFGNKIVDLNKKEFDLLKLFLENKNTVFSRDELLNAVWGFENYPQTRTVDAHIGFLRNKFGSDCIATVHGVGYRWIGQYNV